MVAHPGYSHAQPLAGPRHLLESFRRVAASSVRMGGAVGIEERSVASVISSVLMDTAAAPSEVVPIDGWLKPLRRVKTGRELEKLRQNFALADIGQAAARRAVVAGKREIEIWNEAHSAIQCAAGRRVPLGNDCVIGRRELNFTGWPLDYEIRQGDSLIVDLGTGLDGYWSDGCATYFAGEPTPEQKAMHQTVVDALELAISLVRPGTKVNEIDQRVRDLIMSAGYPDYPHHTGHGVGVSRHEAPRIVPYSEDVLEEGMVIMLEPGIYLPGEQAVRLEDGILVTAGGAEILTQHDKSLP